MDQLLNLVSAINTYLADYILLVLLIGCGLYFSIRTRFVQIRCFGEGMRQVFGNIRLVDREKRTGMSSFQAITAAIAAQVGTGNIVGACGAILVGGPGAIFWMWVIAFFGMATIYAEAVLAQKTRVVNADGSVAGGPIYYIRRAFPNGFGRFLAGFFSVAIVLALGFMGAMVQSNSISNNFKTAFGIPLWVTGICVAVLAGLVFVGGIKRLASVTEKIVPIMAALYILGGLVVLVIRARYLPETFAAIFRYAFQPQAILGGSFAYALKQAISIGANRGLFSNEAGMGSTPHAHALADVDRPHTQGVAAMIGVFIDTFVVVTMTALVVLSTLFAGNGVLAVNPAALESASMAQVAFSSVLGEGPGSGFVAICLLFFAFSTILGWNLFGRININALFGKKSDIPYSIIAILFVFLGSILKSDLVWGLSDLFNRLMVLPNVIALVALGGLVAREAKAGAKDRR